MATGLRTGTRTGTRTIAVYADWDGLTAALRLGLLRARRVAGREVFEFEFDRLALDHRACANLQLDLRLGLYAGRQHPQQGSETFGVFADASPDRWGRLLMRRRLERQQRTGITAKAVHLVESDYLLGVHDAFRVGALRFRLDEAGDFLENRHDLAAPPFVQLRELEAASMGLERDEDNTAAQGDDWLRMLIAPGGSLGGARPKASVVDPGRPPLDRQVSQRGRRARHGGLGTGGAHAGAVAGCESLTVWRAGSPILTTLFSSSDLIARMPGGGCISRRR